MLSPLHDRAILKPRPELHRELIASRLSLFGGTVKGAYKSQDEVNTGDLGVDYRWTHKSGIAFCEVLKLGNVSPYGWGSEVPCKVGDIVLVDQADVEHCLGPKGKEELVIGFKCLLCLWDATAVEPQALSNWVLTKQDEDAMNRLELGAGSTLILPQAYSVKVSHKGRTKSLAIERDGVVSNKGESSSEHNLSQVKVAAERVVNAGPGKFVYLLNKKTGKNANPGQGIFEKPAVKRGDIALFMRACAVTFQLFGTRYRAVPWAECFSLLEDE